MGIFSSVKKAAGKFLGSSAGASIAGGVAGSVVSGLFSASQASKNRAFQAQMSGTAYQRAMADMRKAGLNPILAARLGGASTPPGAMATIPDLGTMFSTALSSQAQRELVPEQKAKLEEEVKNLVMQRVLTERQAQKVAEETINLGMQFRLLKAQEGTERARLWIAQQIREMVERIGVTGDGAGTVINRLLSVFE